MSSGDCSGTPPWIILQSQITNELPEEAVIFMAQDQPLDNRVADGTDTNLQRAACSPMAGFNPQK
jgi:hypothetical protein